MKNNLFIQQLGEYFEVYLPEVRAVSQNTILSYGDAFVILFQFMQSKKGLSHEQITYKMLRPALFDEFILWMKNDRKYSPASICQRISAISAFLKYASRRNVNALNACSAIMAIDLPSIHRAGFPYFTVEELKILLRLPDPSKYLGKRDLVLLSFMYETGARAQEVCNVRIQDVTFGSISKVRLRGKGQKVREVPISEDVKKLIQYYLKGTSYEKSRNLFLNNKNEPMTTACVRSIVLKYVTMAKKQYPALFHETNYSPHSFRHSKAVHMAEADMPIIYIRNFLGHASVKSTEIYARIGQAAVTKALANRKFPELAPDAELIVPEQNRLPAFLARTKKFM